MKFSSRYKLQHWLQLCISKIILHRFVLQENTNTCVYRDCTTTVATDFHGKLGWKSTCWTRRKNFPSGCSITANGEISAVNVIRSPKWACRSVSLQTGRLVYRWSSMISGVKTRPTNHGLCWYPILQAGREIRRSAAMNINHDLDDFQATERVLGQCVSLHHCIVIVFFFHYYYYYYLTIHYKRDGSQ